jgi:SAM-dependent methyltransferase
MLRDIVADARANGGELLPTVWPLEVETETLVDMLPGLVGDAGIQPVNLRAAKHFAGFLGCEPKDLLGPWPKSHLGTLMDVALISRYAGGALSILEVGGGYGRLAEEYLRRGPCHYVLVDAVPAVLMYAYEYLRAKFPDREIGSYYAGDTYADDWDCYILPAWRTDVLGQFEVAVNIEAMQEMNAPQVAHYFGLFDRLLVPGGIAYISNARDWRYAGPWPVPATWDVLYQHNTPRSWTRDHPTIIYRKTELDCREVQEANEAAFRLEMEAWDPKLATLT